MAQNNQELSEMPTFETSSVAGIGGQVLLRCARFVSISEFMGVEDPVSSPLVHIGYEGSGDPYFGFVRKKYDEGSETGYEIGKFHVISQDVIQKILDDPLRKVPPILNLRAKIVKIDYEYKNAGFISDQRDRFNLFRARKRLDSLENKIVNDRYNSDVLAKAAQAILSTEQHQAS